MVYRKKCVRISRNLHTRYGWFWGDFTLRTMNMDFIFEVIEGGIHTGDDGLVLQECRD